MPRNPDSYQDELAMVAALPELLRAHGFSAVATPVHGAMKFVDARAADGSPVRLWVKQGWAKARTYAAVQFGMLEPSEAPRPDAEYAAFVQARAQAMKERGAQYLLLVQPHEGIIQDNYVALDIDDVPLAYRRQLAGWPGRARNGKSPSLYFDDTRDLPEAECVSVVRELAVPLSAIAGVTPLVKGETLDAKRVWAEVERRMKQAVFRLRVGERCGWTCAVSGNRVRKVLEAAHLPGKNWRYDNEATDGILLRVDLHRLLDAELAQLRDGRFFIKEEARCEQYLPFHDKPYTP